MAKIYLVICMFSVVVPFIKNNEPREKINLHYEWPSKFQGKKLVKLELSEQEKTFSQNFPGEIARFYDGRRQIIMRYVVQATRKLHSAVECLKAHGCSVKYLPLFKDHDGSLWSSFSTERKGQRLLIKERITNFYGEPWSDVSAWYWQALFNPETGPWLVITLVENQHQD